MKSSAPQLKGSFLTENFLLSSEPARRLYSKYAANQPIFDYHSHIPAQDIAADRRFANLSELWLEGDHYKWRAMRANGVNQGSPGSGGRGARGQPRSAAQAKASRPSSAAPPAA